MEESLGGFKQASFFSTADSVKWLLALCHAERPKRRTPAVPPELAESDHPVTFDAGVSFTNLRENWKPGGKATHA